MADPRVPASSMGDEKPGAGGGEEGVSVDMSSVSSKLLSDPDVMTALQGRLNSMVGSSSGYIESLPPSVTRRLKSLKKIQLEATKIEAEFYRAVHKLECEYEVKQKPLYEKRVSVTSGRHEPTDSECEWPSDDEDEDEGGNKDHGAGDKKTEPEKEDNTKGIPDFWLTIFRNVDLLNDMVQEHDEPVLSHMEDVTVDYKEDPMGFILNFHFTPNDYFTNNVLTKEYFMKCGPQEDDPFSFEGPEIYKCVGCVIDWKKGKNITMKTVKKKQKNKTASRIVTRQIKDDSFFNFFDPPAIPDDPEANIDVDVQDLLNTDFEIGHYLRERIVPHAVLYFTGEANEEDSDSSGSGEDEEDEDDDEDRDEDEDPDYIPGHKDQKPECKQQ